MVIIDTEEFPIDSILCGRKVIAVLKGRRRVLSCTVCNGATTVQLIHAIPKHNRGVGVRCFRCKPITPRLPGPKTERARKAVEMLTAGRGFNAVANALSIKPQSVEKLFWRWVEPARLQRRIEELESQLRAK